MRSNRRVRFGRKALPNRGAMPNMRAMEMPAAPLPQRDAEPGDRVTASDLVRNFGTWRERALRAPVYILHRGRPRLILASVELVDMLCRPLEGGASDEQRLAALLEGSPDMIVIVDRALGIVAASRSVRARFGAGAARGAPITALVAPAGADLLADAIGRVAVSATAEAIELPLAGEPGARVSLAIEPHPDGVALFGRETGDGANDDRASLDETFALSRGAAVARIDRYGFLDGPHSALAALTGIGSTMLSSLRLVSLFTIETRGAVADLIAAVADDGESRSGAARLLIDSADPRPVTVAVAPRRTRSEIDGVVALILATN